MIGAIELAMFDQCRQPIEPGRPRPRATFRLDAHSITDLFG
jgi:hypothetical protein